MADPARGEYLELSTWQVAVAAGLILVNVAISLGLKLGLGRRLLLASLRTIVQLTLLGLVLHWLFSPPYRWYLTLGLMAVMAVIAGFSAVGRVERRYGGIYLDSIIAMLGSSWLITAVALGAVVQVRPWYAPQYAIPLLGMILGNTLNGISIGIDRLTEQLATRRDEVETLLALGATRWEAGREFVAAAVRTGLIPIINSMMVVGLVSLPGMMTGQLLSGVAPAQAVKYQIVIMFLIAAGTALGAVSATLLAYRRLFNARHQFCHDRLRKREKKR